MKNTSLKLVQDSFSSINPRLIFQAGGGGGETAPRAPESFKGNDKQSDQDAINDVAPQTPKNIASTAVGKATTIQTRYTQSSTILANLVKNDPLLNPNLDQNSTSSREGNTGAASTTPPTA